MMHPALEEAGKATRFGAGNDAREAAAKSKPWSIRNAVRHLASQQPRITPETDLTELLPPEPTLAQLIAMKALVKAAKGNMKAIEYCTDNIDGKVPQQIDQTTTIKEAPTEFATTEEAAAAYAEHIRR